MLHRNFRLIPPAGQAWLRSDRQRFPFRWGQLSLSFAIFTAADGARKLAWGMHHAMRYEHLRQILLFLLGKLTSYTGAQRRMDTRAPHS